MTELIPLLHDLEQTIDKKGVMKCESALHVIADNKSWHLTVVTFPRLFFFLYLFSLQELIVIVLVLGLLLGLILPGFSQSVFYLAVGHAAVSIDS